MNRTPWLALILAAFVLPLRAAEPFRFPEAKHGKGELKHIQGYPVLFVEGTPEEIGEQSAALVRPAAKEIVAYFKSLLKNFGMEMAWPWLVKSADGMLDQFPADHLREMRAGEKLLGGEDANVREALRIANCLWDIKKLGCSALIVQPERSATRAPIFGRNFDFPGLDQLHRYSVLVVCRPQGKHAFGSVTFPGLIGVMSGMNDAGLAIATLDVKSTADGSPMFDVNGTPTLLTFRRILEECTTVAEAEKLLRESKRTTIMNLAVCDRSGGAVFELSPKNVKVRGPEEGVCCCTNHFRCKGLATVTQCERFAALEKVRERPHAALGDVAERLFAANQGSITIQTMVFEPATLEMWLALGKGPVRPEQLRRLRLAPFFKGERNPGAGERFRFPEGREGKGTLKYINDLPVIQVQGAPEEMGRQLGALARPALTEILKFKDAFLEQQGLAKLAWPLLTSLANGIVGRFPADHRAELDALAKAAGVDRELIVLGNAFQEIQHITGCANLVVEPSRSATGQTIMGRNMDWPPLGPLDQIGVIIVYRPKGKHAFAVVGFPGMIGAGTGGINDAGLCLGSNAVNVSSDGSRFNATGTPTNQVLRRILEECTTVEEAEKLLRDAKPSMRALVTICDKTRGVTIEISPKTIVTRNADNGLCCCTNCFLCKELTTKENCWRLPILQNIKDLPKLSVGDVAKKMHAVNQKSWTILTMVFEPATLRLHAAMGKGPATAQPLKTLELKELFEGGH